ncbi:MAG: hypothetical protein GY772_26430 [bacterium]|nr:hypothetical protein [bacterium]
MKLDTILILGGLAGIAYMLQQPKPITRREVTRTYKDGDPEEGEIGLSS